MSVSFIACRIRQGWDEEGRMGVFCTTIQFPDNKQSWAVVIWDDDEDPALIKSAALELSVTEWQPVCEVTDAPSVYVRCIE